MWASYMSETGGLNHSRTNERGFALIAYLFASANSNKPVKYEDFLLYHKEEDQEGTAENILNLLKSLSKG